MSIAELYPSEVVPFEETVEPRQGEGLSDIIRSVRGHGALLVNSNGKQLDFRVTAGAGMHHLIETVKPEVEKYNSGTRILAKTNDPVAKKVATLHQQQILDDIEEDLRTGAERKVSLQSLSHLAPDVRKRLFAMRDKYGALLTIHTRDEKDRQLWNQLKNESLGTKEKNLRAKLDEAVRTNQRLNLPITKELSFESRQLLWQLKKEYGDRLVLDFSRAPEAEKSWKQWNGQSVEVAPMPEEPKPAEPKLEEPRKGLFAKAASVAKGLFGRFARK